MSQQDEPKLDELKKLLRRLERVEAEKADRAARHEKSVARSASPASEMGDAATQAPTAAPTNGSASPPLSSEPVTEPVGVGEAGDASNAAAKLASIKLRAGVTTEAGTPEHGEAGPLNLPTIPDGQSTRALAETEKPQPKGSSIGVVLVAAITAAVVSTIAAVAITAWIIRGGGDLLESSPPVLSADATRSDALGSREPPAADPPPETKVGGSLSETVDVAAADTAAKSEPVTEPDETTPAVTAVTEAEESTPPVTENETAEAAAEPSGDVTSSTNATASSPDTPSVTDDTTDTAAVSAEPVEATESTDGETAVAAESESEVTQTEPVDTGAVLVSDLERPAAADLSQLTETAAEPDKSELVTATDDAQQPEQTDNASLEREPAGADTSGASPPQSEVGTSTANTADAQKDEAITPTVEVNAPADQPASADTASTETSSEQPVVTFETTTTPEPPVADEQPVDQNAAADAGTEPTQSIDTSSAGPAVEMEPADTAEHVSGAPASEPAEPVSDETRVAALDQTERSPPEAEASAAPGTAPEDTATETQQPTSNETSPPADTSPSSQAQAPAPQPPYALVNPQTLAVTPGKAFEFPLSIEARASNLQGHTLIISGLKRGASFSKGVELMFDTWQIPAEDLASVQLQIGEGFARELPITIELRRPDGLPVARSRLTLNLPGNAEQVGIPRELLEAETDKLPEQVQAKVRSAEVALDNGNLRGARIALEEAANQESAYAALLLAMSFDPRQAEAFGTVAGKADTDVARQWYDRAQALGAGVAADFSSGL